MVSKCFKSIKHMVWLWIKDCNFESKKAFGSPVFFESERLLTKVEVIDYKFTEILAKDANYIDGMIEI